MATRPTASRGVDWWDAGAAGRVTQKEGECRIERPRGLLSRRGVSRCDPGRVVHKRSAIYDLVDSITKRLAGAQTLRGNHTRSNQVKPEYKLSKNLPC